MKKQHKEQVLDMIRSTVRTTEPDAQIILYGSRARGDNHNDSDWDIIVLLNRPKMTHYDRSEISCELWEKGLEMGEHINAFVYTHNQWDTAPPSMFKHNVREEGIQL